MSSFLILPRLLIGELFSIIHFMSLVLAHLRLLRFFKPPTVRAFSTVFIKK